MKKLIDNQTIFRTSNSSRTTSVKVGYFPNVDCKRFCGFSKLSKKSKVAGCFNEILRTGICQRRLNAI